jgi:hypothetical protein
MTPHGLLRAVTFSLPQLLTLIVVGVLIYGVSRLRPRR